MKLKSSYSSSKSQQMNEKKEQAKTIVKDYKLKFKFKGEKEKPSKVFKDKLLNVLENYIQSIEIGYQNDNIRRTGLLKKKPFVDPYKEELKKMKIDDSLGIEDYQNINVVVYLLKLQYFHKDLSSENIKQLICKFKNLNELYFKGKVKKHYTGWSEVLERISDFIPDYLKIKFREHS